MGADGTWSLASEVKPGSYELQVVRKDAAGKVISQSPVVSLDIPSTEAAPVLDTPQVAADNTITLTGTEEASPQPEQTADESGGTGGQAYVVQPGDTLTGLAQEYLGSETRYPEIVAATNVMAKQDPAFKQITDPNLIVVGQQIWIPAP